MLSSVFGILMQYARKTWVVLFTILNDLSHLVFYLQGVLNKQGNLETEMGSSLLHILKNVSKIGFSLFYLQN